MTRPIRARVELSALERNLAVARRLARHSKVMAVVKANAYGHGLLACAQALERADGFGVVELDQAVALREAGHRQTILLLGGFFRAEELPLFAHYQLSAVVHEPRQIEMLRAYPAARSVDVFLKLNTGMNRLGFAPADFPAALQAVRGCAAVRGIALMTHFASAEEPGGTRQALERFGQAARGLGLPVSLANSAALMRDPRTHGDWVRPGIMLYGGSPFADQSGEALGLAPAMALEAEIIGVQQVAAGESVGYNGTFTAEYPMRVGTVACGYADGYPRHCGSGTPVLVEGRRSRTLGRVSMDMLAVDLTPMPDVGVGSTVCLWGPGLPVEEVARAAGTVNYELLCAVSHRVPIVAR